jgi:hypothetical protein
MNRLLFLLFILLYLDTTGGAAIRPIAKRIIDAEAENIFIKADNLFIQSNTSIFAESIIKNATILELNFDAAAKLIEDSPEYICITIPLKNDKPVKLKLFRNNFFAPDLSVVTSSNTDERFLKTNGIHYWGIISDDYNSIAAISIFKNEVMGIISSPGTGNIILGPIENDNASRHIIYNENNFQSSNGNICLTNDFPVSHPIKNPLQNSIASAKCVRLYWEVNYDLYQNKGGMTAVTNFITGIFNQSALLFANDGITVTLSQMFIWNSPSPYTQTTIGGIFSQFQDYRNSFNGDIANLIGIGGGGIAGNIGSICDTNIDYLQCFSGISTSYSNIPIYSPTIFVVTHEEGHLLGSFHTHACVWNGNNTAIDGCGPAAGYAYEGSCTGAPIPSNGGTIMSYCHLVSTGINFSKGFGSQPANAILNVINSAPCLSSCATANCDTPSVFTAGKIGVSSVTLGWNIISAASSYKVQYRKAGNSLWNSITVNSDSINLTGLTSQTNYEWRVQTICASGSSSFTTTKSFTTSSQTFCGIPSLLNATQIMQSSAKLSWTNITGALRYNFSWKSTSSSSWTTISNITSTDYSLSGLLSCTSYEFKVQAICSSNSGTYSNSFTFLTTGCQQSYCSSKGTNSSYYINKVSIGSINNTSGNNGGYYNYTALNANLTKNNSATITLTPSVSSSSKYWNVYIDYNQNGSFEDAGEKVATGHSYSAVTLSFAIPSTAQNGSTRMRIQMKTSSAAYNSCATFTYGEVEDYSVSILPAPLPFRSFESIHAENSHEQFSVNIFPDPARDLLFIKFSEDSSNYEAAIFDVEGRMLEKEIISFQKEDERGEINVSELKNGIYFISIKCENHSTTKRFLILK